MSDNYTNTDGRSDSYNAGAAHDAGLYDPNLHDNQIVAVFENRAAADQAARMLREAGTPEAAIQVIDQLAGDAVPGASHAEDTNQEVGIWGLIKTLFAPQSDYHDYHHALGQGHAMVVVVPTAETDRHRVIQVLEASGPIDFDAKLAEWRQAGYDATGAARSAQTAADAASLQQPPAPAPKGTAYELHSRETPAPRTGAARLDEDRVRVGWREQPQGATRVRSYVAERGTGDQQVRLHEERIGQASAMASGTEPV